MKKELLFTIVLVFASFWKMSALAGSCDGSVANHTEKEFGFTPNATPANGVRPDAYRATGGTKATPIKRSPAEAVVRDED